MDAARRTRRSYLEALLIGLAAAAAVHVPPLSLAQRVDGLLYALWSRLPSAAPPGDMLIVAAETPASFSALAELAQQHGARLLVTTLTEPPDAAMAAAALGPTDIPIGEARLRHTGWTRGGHLWLRIDADGLVRHDWPVLDAAAPVPSLGYAAALQLVRADAPLARQADHAGRRWLRLYTGRPFRTHSLDELAERPELIADAVLIAGGDEPLQRTPLGRMPPRELLAHVVAGYRQQRAIEAGPVGSAIAWALAAALLVSLTSNGLRPSRPRVWMTAAAAGGLVAGSAGSFAVLSLWMPVTGPIVLLLGAAAAAALRRPEPAAEVPAELHRARALAAAGQLRDSWTAYAAIPSDPQLLPELYALGCALERYGERTRAAYAFQRIAQTDARFRDVARRLVRCGGVAVTAAAEPAAPAAGSARAAGELPARLDRYQLLEPIGRGAMGCVYLGRDPRINRIVAIKAVDLAAEFEPEEIDAASRAFQREAETAGRLSHPNIVTIFDVGEAHGFAYIAMEYVKGRHLSDCTSPGTLLPPAKVLTLVARAADALDYAHEQNVVHRDIKPANIMYDSVSDALKITDFGIARLIGASRTRTGIVLGTPAFMSPEQVEGKNVNGHTDLFALGVSLYQLLTGRLPFRGASMTNLMFVIANEPHEAVTAVRGDLPGWLNRIVDRALAKDPAERFRTGAQMAAALREGAAALG